MGKVAFSLGIPLRAKLTVKAGDLVKKGEVLTEPEAVEEKTIHIDSELGVEAKKAVKYLKVGIGQEVTAGDVLAKKDGLWQKKTVNSPLTGVVAKISEEHGTVTMRASAEVGSEVRSPVGGKIIDAQDKEVTTEVLAKEFGGERGQGEAVMGAISVAGGSQGARLDQLTSDYEGKIVVVARAAERPWLEKAEAVGAVGLVAVKMAEDGIAGLGFLEMEAGTDGLMEKKIFEELVKLEGNFAYLDPAKKILAVVES